MNNKAKPEIINALRFWFIVHFITDTVIAIPLFLFPTQSLLFLGWETIDPVMTRVVAAALLGIGIESWLVRNSNKREFISMLNLKIIWSFFASLGLLLSIWQGMFENLIVGWIIFSIFGLFHLLWVYYRIKLQKIK